MILEYIGVAILIFIGVGLIFIKYEGNKTKE